VGKLNVKFLNAGRFAFTEGESALI